jgi:hypothetical protein
MTKAWRGRPTPESIAALNTKRGLNIASAVAVAEVRTVKRKGSRKANARLVGDSLLTRGVEHKDVKMEAMALGFTLGSKALCAAILATGRTHGPMTEAAQMEAVRYAHDIYRK